MRFRARCVRDRRVFRKDMRICIVPILSACALAGGCVSNLNTHRDPAMPRVVLPEVPAAEAVPVVIARARALAERDDFRGAVESLRSVAEQQRASAARRLVEEFTPDSPTRAAQLALALPHGVDQRDLLAMATRARMRQDANGTVLWAIGILDPGSRYAAMDSVAGELVKAEPRGALERLQALPDRPGRLELLRLAAAHWARRDPDAALAWADALPAELRTHIVASIGFEVAQTAPERAVGIASSVPEGRDRWLLLSEIAQTWTARNPDQAVTWMRSLPAGEAREAALAGIDSATGAASTRRARTVQGAYRGPGRLAGGGGSGGPSPVVAADATALPPGPAREQALRREFERRLQTSPALAANWLATLPAPEVNDDILRRLTQEWMRYDPASALSWLELHVPTASRREQILNEIVW